MITSIDEKAIITDFLFFIFWDRHSKLNYKREIYNKTATENFIDIS